MGELLSSTSYLDNQPAIFHSANICRFPTWDSLFSGDPNWNEARSYQDKLDGKISEEFWMRKSGEWQAEENQNRTSMQGLEMNGSAAF
jgi:hypothetical protein